MSNRANISLSSLSLDSSLEIVRNNCFAKEYRNNRVEYYLQSREKRKRERERERERERDERKTRKIAVATFDPFVPRNCSRRN